MTTFEQGFEETERAADAAAKAVGSLLAATKQLKKAARERGLGKRDAYKQLLLER